MGAQHTDGARPRDWAGLALLAVPCMLVSVNSNLLNLALPALARDLRPTTSELLWISDTYVFLVAGLLLPMGALADRFGRRRLLLLGAAIFGLASIAAMFANGSTMLIMCRGLIGVGAAMLAPSTRSLIRSMFRVPQQLAIALGIWTASFALGGILGPLVGGLLIEEFSWRAIFAVTPPVMLALLLAGPFVLPEFRSSTTGRRIDALGVALAVIGLLATVYAIKQLGTQASPFIPVVSGLAGILLLAAFIRRQGRIAEPILDLELFRHRSFTVPQLGNALAFAVLYGIQLLIGQYLQAVLGMSPLEAGLWTIPSAGAYAIGGLIAPRLGIRLGTTRLLAVGLAVSAVGFGLVAGVGTSWGLLAFVLGSVIYSFGLAPVYQATTESSIAAVPADRAGVAGATFETITNLGGALGIALFGSLAGAIYRMGTARLGSPTQSIGDLATHVTGLSESDAEDFIHSAQSAFVDGLQLIALSGAVLLLVAAIATPRILTDRKQFATRPPQDPGVPSTSSSRAR